ncbi:hypothetical protein F66182_5860 [Fusarium sp. NRRL 66182]|nr:hypothetical protein F66182_5860 [Fusarium sp. NRRL 66182]
MATATATAEALILQNPTNPVNNPLYTTGSDKVWARQYKPMKNIIPRTAVSPDGVFHANFEDAFLPLLEDDSLRLRQRALPPNKRQWRLETEADCENWFNTEIVNVVLAAWHGFPMMMQSSHVKPLVAEQIPENVDFTFSVKFGGSRRAVAIGEIKRNLIAPEVWQGADLSRSGQSKLSQELRGYAHKYECPQVFCFDGKTLVLLQFRADKADDIKEENCPIDCWVIPVKGSSCSIRSKRRFSLSSLSPASKRYNQVMSQRNDNRRSVDTTATSSTLGGMPVTQVESYLVDPAYRWTTANRVG